MRRNPGKVAGKKLQGGCNNLSLDVYGLIRKKPSKRVIDVIDVCYCLKYRKLRVA